MARDIVDICKLAIALAKKARIDLKKFFTHVEYRRRPKMDPELGIRGIEWRAGNSRLASMLITAKRLRRDGRYSIGTTPYARRHLRVNQGRRVAAEKSNLDLRLA